MAHYNIVLLTYLLTYLLPDSESAIRFAIGSTVSPFWVFPGWHFTHSERNGPIGLVNVLNGSVGTVTSRHHTGRRGGPAIVSSHNGRYIVVSVLSKYFRPVTLTLTRP